jgi:hypothetical protein
MFIEKLEMMYYGNSFADGNLGRRDAQHYKYLLDWIKDLTKDSEKFSEIQEALKNE